MPMKRSCVLVFAGVDPSGGAGIAADIEAIGAGGAHPLPVITVLTVQDNNRVHGVHPVDAALVAQQAQALIDKIAIAAVKIGVVGSRANADAIAEILRALQYAQPGMPVVLDPVLGSGKGDALAAENPVDALAPLFELATLLTPNLIEASRLCDGEADIERQAAMLLARGCRNVLIKGGHGLASDDVANRWFGSGGGRSWRWPRLAGEFHGSGCTLASAIAARLANGMPMDEALVAAQAYTHQTLESAYAIADGQRIPGRRIISAHGTLENPA